MDLSPTSAEPAAHCPAREPRGRPAGERAGRAGEAGGAGETNDGGGASGAGDPEALVNRHVRAVWRYLRMHGADPHEADDLTQEAFVVALQKGAAHLDPAATATFLRRTARFLFLRLRARRSRDGGSANDDSRQQP